ncbi:MAG: HAMP domain-containing methyl-accepting chemotaxis protein [Gammaproteobacteria bacterium]|nr:HAMP domain-containing methyl-accepting chemotaxis protein [Gammaproteobacteria bacterium]
MFLAIKSIKSKILVALFVVFALIIVITTIRTASNERDMVMQLAIDKTQLIANTYFDNINTMMLSGTMAQRSLLRQKLLEEPGISNVKIIRADNIVKLFGPGNPEQVIEDDIDRQGMNSSEPLIVKGENDQGRMVSIVLPLPASSNYKATNCLTCHVVDEDTLLGTVRVDYSLQSLDNKISNNLWNLLLINIAVTVVGLFLIQWYLGYVALNPLEKIRDIMSKNADKRDLTQAIDITSDDEIGHVALAFNKMLENFSHSLSQVRNSVTQLNQNSSAISTSAEETTRAARNQQQETESVANAVSQMEQAASEVGASATNAAQVSRQADEAATQGAETTQQAIDGIFKLVGNIENAAEVITALNQQSEGVGAVLDVIRSIAEQTNLLALNAAIEAARAGEQGRGFAVVADEVRTLAIRSHESTQEIERIIEQLQNGARQAVEVMTEAKQQAESRKSEVQTADHTLKGIAQDVSEIHRINETMNETMVKQAEITSQVLLSISNISKLSENTTADSENTAQQSDELVRLAKGLDDLIDQFHFKQQG